MPSPSAVVPEQTPFYAFCGARQLAYGELAQVLREVLHHLAHTPNDSVLFLDGKCGSQIDFDLRGQVDEVLARLPAHPHFAPPRKVTPAPSETDKPPGPGRPRLGVVSREVSLLPRHWRWLEAQPKGISVTLRKLVETASRQDNDAQVGRQRQQAATRFITVVAGDAPGFEAACRAIYADDRTALQTATHNWSPEIVQALHRYLGTTSAETEVERIHREKA